MQKTRRISRSGHGRSTYSSISRITQSGTPEKRAAELRNILQELGPYYRNFALYLSSRIDLFPAEYCREFALVPDSAPPLSQEQVERILEQELGPRRVDAFATFDNGRAETTLLTQAHVAQLRNGASVIVVLLRPEFHELTEEHSSPSSFDPRRLAQSCAELLIDDTVQDFIGSLARKTDFRAQAEAMASVSRAASSCAFLGTRRIFSELCTSRVMVLEHFKEHSLEQFLQIHPHQRETLATRLCHAWLRLAFMGNCLPVDPRQQNVTLSEDGRFYLRDCHLVALPKRQKEDLQKYLMAAATDDPDKAALHLLRELSRVDRSQIDVESFRSSFRQAAQFGVLEPVLGTNSNALPQLIFQQWKTALEHGYRPGAHLLSFYRGLFSLARIARVLSPLRDSFREGLEEFWLAGTLDEVWGLGDWQSWSHNLDKYATVFATLPNTLDQSLSPASNPNQAEAAAAETGPAHGEQAESRGILTVVVVLAIAVLASQTLHIGLWTARLAVLATMLAGLLAIRRLSI